MQFLEIWHGCVKVHLKINNSLELVQDCKRFAVSLESGQLCNTTPEAWCALADFPAVFLDVFIYTN